MKVLRRHSVIALIIGLCLLVYLVFTEDAASTAFDARMKDAISIYKMDIPGVDEDIGQLKVTQVGHIVLCSECPWNPIKHSIAYRSLVYIRV